MMGPYIGLQPITVGSVVRLNSGGPVMTVTELDDMEGLATCEWWNGLTWQAKYFPVAALVISNPVDVPEPFVNPY